MLWSDVLGLSLVFCALTKSLSSYFYLSFPMRKSMNTMVASSIWEIILCNWILHGIWRCPLHIYIFFKIYFFSYDTGMFVIVLIFVWFISSKVYYHVHNGDLVVRLWEFRRLLWLSFLCFFTQILFLLQICVFCY